MKDNFNKAVEFVIRIEGGYVNHPNDAGGETKFGISKKAYPQEDIKSLTKDRAAFLYRRDYWTPMDCDNLAYPLDFLAFDAAVNCGVGRARRWLKDTGGNSIAFLFKRLEYYIIICKLKSKYRVFLVGWIDRILGLYQEIVKGGD